jgi:hypothetical protein
MFSRTNLGVLTASIQVVAIRGGHANTTNSIQKYSGVIRLETLAGIVTGKGIRVTTHLPNGTARLIRRAIREVPKSGGVRKRKKPGRISRPLEIKYGVPIPRNAVRTLELNAEANNTFSADAIRKEVASLLALNCFSFHAPDNKPNSEYRWTKLSMIFEVKQDGRRKARLVAGGHLVDSMGISSRSMVIKGISVRLLDLIAHRENLKILCGDIGNAFITADCVEKMNSRAGPEFRRPRRIGDGIQKGSVRSEIVQSRFSGRVLKFLKAS